MLPYYSRKKLSDHFARVKSVLIGMIKLSGPFYELIEISRNTNGEYLEAKHNSLFLASMSSCQAARWVFPSNKRLVNDVLHPNTQHIQMEGVPLSWWKFYS